MVVVCRNGLHLHVRAHRPPRTHRVAKSISNASRRGPVANDLRIRGQKPALRPQRPGGRSARVGDQHHVRFRQRSVIPRNRSPGLCRCVLSPTVIENRGVFEKWRVISVPSRAVSVSDGWSVCLVRPQPKKVSNDISVILVIKCVYILCRVGWLSGFNAKFTIRVRVLQQPQVEVSRRPSPGESLREEPPTVGRKGRPAPFDRNLDPYRSVRHQQVLRIGIFADQRRFTSSAGAP